MIHQYFQQTSKKVEVKRKRNTSVVVPSKFEENLLPLRSIKSKVLKSVITFFINKTQGTGSRPCQA